MKKSTFKILTVLLLSSVMGWAQQLQTTPGQTENFTQIQSVSIENNQQQPMAAGTASLQAGGPDYALMSTPQVITYSNSQAIGTSNVCPAGDNKFYRVFDLDDDFGITTDFQVSAAEFGVLFQLSNPVSDYPYTVNVYASTGTFPNDTRTLLATTNVLVPVANNATVVSTPISATIPLGENLVYEIITNPTSAGDSYTVGQNTAGETGPSWWEFPSCGISSPVVTTQNLVMNIVGNELLAFDVCGTPLGQPIPAGAPGTTAGEMTPSVATVNASGMIGPNYYIDRVEIDITHTFTADLVISLAAPDGTELILSDTNGGSGDNFTNTVFQDGGANISSASAPFTGTFQPQGGTFANTFNGLNVNGDWELRVLDQFGADVGTLNNFCIYFEPNERPVLLCSNITLPNDAGLCGAVNNLVITATDTEDGTISAVQTAGIPFGDLFPVGTSVVEFTATDSGGNFTVCTFSVTVEDTEVPNALCIPTIVIELDANGEVGITASDIDGGSTDNCGIDTITISQTDFDCTHLGDNTVTLTVTDTTGNFSECTTVVTVVDNIPPVVTCLTNQIVDADFGVCDYTHNGTDWDATATDNCSVTVEYELTGATIGTGSSLDGVSFNLGETTVTWTATDGSANTDVCSFTITVEDNQAPVVTAPGDITVDNDPGECFATDIDLGTPAIEENCEQVLIGWDIENAPVNATTVAPSYTDPLITTALLNGGQRVENQLGSNVYVTRQFGSISKPVFNMTLAEGVFVKTFTFNHRHNHNPGHTTNPDYYAQLQVDAGGTGNYVDIGDPVLLSPATIGNQDVIELNMYLPEGTNNFRFNAVGLNGGTHTGTEYFGVDNVVITYSLEIDNDAPVEFPVGDTVVTWTVTDGSGNTATDTQIVTVEDNELPNAVCVAPFTIYLDANGEAGITFADIDAGSTDNCSIASISIDKTEFSCADLGDNVVTLTVEDSNGNISTCTTVVTVADELAPQIVCPIDIVINTEPGACEATVFFSAASAFDNCDGFIPTVQTAGPPTGSSFPIGVTTITFTATDSNGNISSCDLTITVVDNQAPLAVCQNLTIQLDADGLATINAEDLDGGSTDNCGSGDLTFTASQTSFDCSHLGENTIVLTVTDAEGNSSTCNAIVTVEDSIAPVAACVAPFTIQLDINGEASITAADIDAGSTDNCSIDSITLSQSMFTCADLGENEIILTVTDVAGNTTTCITTVTVVDDIAPVVNCIDFTLELGPDGTAFLTPEDLGGTSTDNCEITVTAIDIEEFDCLDIGTPVLVTYFASDASGNIASCSAMVNVVDNLGPVIECPADLTVDTDPDSITYTVPDYFAEGLASVTDNCTDPVTITGQVPAPGTLLVDGTYTITLSATDEYGNESTCSFELTVETILGAEDRVDFDGISMYPNPAMYEVTIGNPQRMMIDRISVYDLQGRLVISEKNNGDTGNQTLDVSELSSAVYMVIIESNGQQAAKRLIKK